MFTMYCKKCGTKLTDEAVFCFKCGEKNLINPNINYDNSETIIEPNNVDTAKIKEYLGHAKTLEVNRYTLNKTINRLQAKIDTLGLKYTFSEPTGQRGDFKIPYWITFFVCLVIGVIVTLILEEIYGGIAGIVMVVAVIFDFPISLVIAAVFFGKKSGKRKEEYLKAIEYDNMRVEYEKEQIVELRNQQNELSKEVKNIEYLLGKLYSANLLYPKYRELVPVVTIWEYIDSGRCVELSGANGAYNLFESESRQNVIISNLNQVVATLEEIKNTQYALYEAVQESNEIADRMYRQTEQLLASNRAIERNSEISAYNSRIAAQNSSISAYIDFCKF